MWIQLSEKERELILGALDIADHVAPIHCKPGKPGELQEKLKTTAQARGDLCNAAWIDRARELHTFGSSDSREVDEDAVVAYGDEGAYVMMWGWVRNDEMGVEEGEDEDVCRTCGEEYAQGGDGFDGECPDCADKTDQAENPENYK